MSDPEKPASTKPRPGSILFVCAMNSIRSPMAEHLTRSIYGNSIFTQSAGIRAGDLDGFMVAAMAEKGIDLSGYASTTLDELEDGYYDLIVTLAPEAHHRALELTRSQAVDVEYWPTMDPSTVAGSREQVLDAYRQTRDMIEARIRARFG
ncbi:MAG: arsenate reductase ArsC [Rhizobiaceae bacterium]